MSFAVGNLQPTHAKLIAYFLGYLSDDFRSIADDPNNQPQPGDDDITIEMKLFFSAAALACVNDIPVFVDA